MSSLTATQARDQVMQTIKDAWDASGTTASIALLYDNVRADPIGNDANGNPLPWGRATVRTFTSPQDLIKGDGSGIYQTEGRLVVEIYTPVGDGHALTDAIVEVLKTATRNQRTSGGLWFFEGVPNEVGLDGAWFRTDYTSRFRYHEEV